MSTGKTDGSCFIFLDYSAVLLKNEFATSRNEMGNIYEKWLLCKWQIFD